MSDRRDDPILFVLVMAFAVAFILVLHDTAHTPARATAQPRYVMCGNPAPADEWEPLTYDDVEEAMLDLCDRREFPFCHTLPVPLFNTVPDDLIDNGWLHYDCARDLVPDGGCVFEHLPPHEGRCLPPFEPTPLAPVR